VYEVHIVSYYQYSHFSSGEKEAHFPFYRDMDMVCAFTESLLTLPHSTCVAVLQDVSNSFYFVP
jgi:hypothetical protein